MWLFSFLDLKTFASRFNCRNLDFSVIRSRVEFVAPRVALEELFGRSFDALVGDQDVGVDGLLCDRTLEEFVLINLVCFIAVIFKLLLVAIALHFEVALDHLLFEGHTALNQNGLVHKIARDLAHEVLGYFQVLRLRSCSLVVAQHPLHLPKEFLGPGALRFW